MKIKDLKTFVVGNPPPHRGGPYFVFVKLITDDGIEGIGEAYGVPFNPKVIEQMITDVVEQHVVGADPFQIERLWRIVYSRAYAQHPDFALMGVLSAVETACWDIIGKSLNQPIYNLLGGQVHEKLRSYTYIYPEADDFGSAGSDEIDPIEIGNVFGDAVKAPKRAEKYVEQGFTAVKFDPIMPMSAFDPRQLSLRALNNAELVVKNIREAVGDQCDLLIGTHGQPNAAGAIRLAERLEPYHPLWFEEPVPPENMDEMARVARATKIPVATGERLATKYEFAALFSKQAASIIQPALGRVGGILEAKKIAGMAEAHYVQIAPHLYCGPVEAAANIQISACSPNFLIQESIERFDNFHAKILKKPIQWDSGFIIPPCAPGLGVELDEEVAEAHPYDGSALFPEMEEQYIL